MKMIARVIEVGRVKEGRHQQDFVQHEEGICRCICTGHHASTPHLLKTMVSEPQVLTPKRTEFGKAIRNKYEKHEIEISRHDMTTMEPREDGVSNTLTSVQKDNLLAEPFRIPEATKQGYAEAYDGDGDGVNLALTSSKTRRGRVGKQMANTLDTGCQQGVVTNYRIRKLTPRECFRLMGVDDKDIDTIQAAGISNSQQYKMAGNSIVVDVLYHIFRKMFCETHSENIQQTLF